MRKKSFAIVIPTYSGIETITEVLESIAVQPEAKDVQLIIVIDGPNSDLRALVDGFLEGNSKRFKSVKIKQFKQNKGRFFARYEGAKLAESSDLIFIDDRTVLKADYLKNLTRLSKNNRAIISTIKEESHPNFISKALYAIRSWVYRNKKENFKPYDITEDNFEKSPKGTAGFCVEKSLFLDASKKFLDEGGATATSNDDTRLLRHIVEATPIHRSPALVLMYAPRAKWVDELLHIYKRGPMFIDYYLRFGSRYFWHLIFVYATSAVALTIVIIKPVVLLVFALCLLLAFVVIALVASRGPIDRLKTSAGVILTAASFVGGIYVGTVQRLFRQVLNIMNKRIISSLLTIAVLCLFGWYIATHTNDFRVLLDINPIYIMVLILIGIAGIVINGLFMKWSITLFDKNITFKESIKVSLISTVGNFFAPAGSGLGFRAVYLKKQHNLTYSDYISVVFCNYILSFFVTSLLGLVAIFSLRNLDSFSSKTLLIAFATLFTASFLGFFVRVKKSFVASRKNPIVKKIAEILMSITNGWQMILSNRRTVVGLLGLMVLNTLLLVLSAFILTQSINAQLPIAGVILFGVIGSLSLFINITPGNLGIKEAAIIIFSTTIGLSTSQVLSVAIIERATLFIVMLMLWLLFVRKISV